MNGMKPKFMNGDMPEGYFAEPNPYESAPSCHVDLLKLSRYAKKMGKQISELTREEINKFTI